MAKHERKTMNAKKVLDSSLKVGEDKINIKQNASRIICHLPLQVIMG